MIDTYHEPTPDSFLDIRRALAFYADSRFTTLTKGLSMYETQIVENTIRPVSPEGDAWFGLESGTNGTAATMRRMNAPAGLEWRRHDGKPATGLLLNPRGREWINPWDGRAS